MNSVSLVGRLTADPTVRYTQAEQPLAIASFTLAVDRRVKKEGEQSADFITCKAFGKLAETIEKYLGKGRKIAITGRIQTGNYTKQDGTKVYTTDVIADSMDFCDSKNSSDNVGPAPADQFMTVPDNIDDEIPFN